ncbi:MAG TPA: ATP-dependent helicase, partial [Segetibacter sp.]
GRTGRADKKGIAISFITPKEQGNKADIESLMKLQIPLVALPANLQISDVLTEDEIPKVHMKEIQVKVPKKEERGASFHEKSAKNSRVNKKVSRKDQMKKKYGKPITRRGKK